MEELIRQSTLLRDMIETDIQNTANDLEAQRLAVNYAFRNRIHEVGVLGSPRDFFAFFGTKFEINQCMGWELEREKGHDILWPIGSHSQLVAPI